MALYQLYKEYCNNNIKTIIPKNEAYKRLEEIGINSQKGRQNNVVYQYSKEQLLSIYKSKSL
ncbi:hypothetical protein DFA_10491 [Cavenderia fasciculata]|uniref:Uncharacterized protein n=1 Tax=Cavenderia fasciculata TaxID=261658 RepID=F4QAD0_CACFS|nr:uncharacterized protein DFA_10491 [Cavenderia fasciculata]EGG15649.1 hypothetical protein DFA_10491 [Cavenderia fasciculata]|eukprot:XP_004354391.1 hypothetical protein DFA_10491 [Cavenderia fasciculata]